MQQSFYVDSCIYLNLWQKEGDERFGVPYWKIAQDFFEKFDNDGVIIYYSGFVLNELGFILTDKEFRKKRKLFASHNFKKAVLSEEEFSRAREIESELGYGISFYDIIHSLLAIKTDFILITRDKKLLEASKKLGVRAKKPEDLL